MGTLAHLRNVYDHAFKDCRPLYLVYLLKGYALFCALMLSMALDAFVDRVFTGFDFYNPFSVMSIRKVTLAHEKSRPEAGIADMVHKKTRPGVRIYRP